MLDVHEKIPPYENPMRRRSLLHFLATALVLMGSGCLGLLPDSGRNDSNESSLFLSNHQEESHTVEVDVKNLREEDQLVDETVSVAPDENHRFYFPIGDEIGGRYPQIRASVRMAEEPAVNDSVTRSFPPSSGASLMATVEESGEIDVTETAT